MVLKLSLLGKSEVHLNGKPLDNLSAEKAHALLYYLSVESDRAHRREFLAEMFWPGNPPGYARNSLKQTLSQLKKALSDKETDTPFLISSKRDIQFNGDSSHRIDVLDFQGQIKKSKSHEHEKLASCETCIELLKKATNLYRGDFLSDFYLPDSPEFNEWILTKREFLRRLLVDSLNQMIDFHEDQNKYNKAVDYAKGLVEYEPWNESSHRKLMALLALSGRRSAALKQYQICESMLASEFDAQPTPETTALYERIKDWKVNKDSSFQGESIGVGQEPSVLVPDLVESPEKTLSTWVKATALVSFLALAAILYLAFLRDSSPLNKPISPGAESEQTSSETSGDPGGAELDSDENAAGQTRGVYLSDPNQICLEREKLLYVEDFEDKQGQGWPEIEFRAQSWDIVPEPKDSENYVLQNSGKQETIIFYRGEFPQDAVFRINFYSTAESHPIFLWHSNNNPYEEERGLVTSSDYSFGFLDHGLHFIRFTHPLPEVSLHDGEYWMKNEIWHQLEISTFEGMLNVWLDGEELLAYQDPNPLPTGTIGIGIGDPRKEGVMVYFDNLSVCELSEPFESVFKVEE